MNRVRGCVRLRVREKAAKRRKERKDVQDGCDEQREKGQGRRETLVWTWNDIKKKERKDD